MSNNLETNEHCARTRAMAGPRPLQRAATPSAAMVLRAQSRNPEYVPVGADWILDFSTCTLCQTYAKHRQDSCTNIGRDSNRPHCDTGRTTRNDDRAEVEV